MFQNTVHIVTTESRVQNWLTRISLSTEGTPLQYIVFYLAAGSRADLVLTWPGFEPVPGALQSLLPSAEATSC